MNHTLSHNTSIRKLETEYYQSYSADRYINTDDSSFHILTPFNKEYINRDNQHHGHIEQYIQLINDVIEHTLKIKRYDILSYYHDHNNSPSVRSLHTAKLLFLIDGLFYYYNIYDDQLLLVSHSEIDSSIYKRDRLYIFGLSDVLNLTRFYSEFSLYASFLDAGHLLYNVKNVLVNKNIDFLQFKKFNSKYLFENINIDSRYCYASFAIEISPEYKENQKMDKKAYVTARDKRLSVAHNELRPTKYLEEILAHYNSSIDMEESYVNTNHIPSFQLTSKLIRNSAHTTIGNHNYGEKFGQFNPVDVLTILKKSKSLFSSNGMEYCFLIKTDKGEYVYWSDITCTNLAIDFRKIMYDDHKFFDFKTYNIVFLCFSDRNKVVENGLKNHLIPASEMMQLVALYSSSVGYAFRPMKNHHDHYLKNILTLGEQYEINFMGVVCNSPIQQLSYYLK
ncbi:hypothetical protein [Paucisalibacillus sp. EB02]|uniref:hypothetical protein n=1 Tax=Paucisalibacillus sp. EB02 TaxID=1347087 RepID=UPI0004BA7E4E|nr:hypothetical protein [Paucisalibacillus sp. EB02]